MTLFTYGVLAGAVIDYLPLAVIKRRGRGAAGAYAVMPLAAWCALHERTTP